MTPEPEPLRVDVDHQAAWLTVLRLQQAGYRITSVTAAGADEPVVIIAVRATAPAQGKDHGNG